MKLSTNRGLTVLATVAVFGLSSCGVGGSGGGGNSIAYASWGGAWQAAQEEAILKPFAKNNDVQVKSEGPTDYAKIKAQVQSGKVDWDVAQVEGFWAVAQCGKLLEELADLDSSTLRPEGVSRCGLPVSSTAYVLTYNTEMYQGNTPTSWADFFDVKKFPGKRAVWNHAPGGALEVALLADGVAPKDLYPLDVDRALAKLKSIKDDIVFFDTGAQLTQMLEQGQAGMSIAWHPRAFDAESNGAKIAPVWNQSLLVFDLLVVPKGAEHSDKAKQLIKYAFQPETQKRFINTIPAGSGLQHGPLPDSELARRWSPDTDKAKRATTFIDQNWWAKNFDSTSEKWTAWTSG
jgi:putative spermidine/putrescine transport system substrate-binding protein